MEQTEADKAALKHLEPVEPDFIVQSDDKLSDAERHLWSIDVAQRLRAAGVVHVRYLASSDAAQAFGLVEGWKAVPANEGAPRWQPASAV